MPRSKEIKFNVSYDSIKDAKDDGCWECPTCENLCMSDWAYCPYCGDTDPNEEK